MLSSWFKKKPPVLGYTLSPPKITWLGIAIATILFLPPALAFILFMDVFIGWVIENIFGVCVTLACLL